MTGETSLSSDDMARMRTLMAADRTLMAWVRTALSMISFGFTIFKFFRIRECVVAQWTVLTASEPATVPPNVRCSGRGRRGRRWKRNVAKGASHD